VVWIKEVGASGGVDGGWRGDFPLDHELPKELAVDCQRLRLPIHPMFFVRLQVFADWHRAEGRQVEIMLPTDPLAKKVFQEMEPDPDNHSGDENDSVVAVSRLQEFNQVETVSARTKEILEYQLTDVSTLGEATFMAVSDENPLGTYVAVRRMTEPRPQVSIAISDLGVGIPEHIRQRYPEWSDDGWAIAHATEDRITGTGDPHRGFGFSAILESALTTSLHAAQMTLLSANGFCRVQLVQEQRKVEVFPAPKYRRGTWITYDLISV